ncbi:hypothetical protein BASA81_012647 [Batrachochytrium salamandrivorans]|nr:hypothetical protein BASA81_012647 [Batrachochytrium salamandrivorans]
MKRAAIALVTINVLMLLLALVGLGYSIYVVATEGRLCEDCLTIPVIWGWSAFGLTLCVAFVSLLAIVATCRHIKSILIFMAFFTFITFAASVALTVILSMWTSQTDLGALSGVF